MEFDLKKTLEALLLSTAEPISLKALVSVFACHHSKLAEALKKEGSEEVLEASYPRVTQKQISVALAELIAAAETENLTVTVDELAVTVEADLQGLYIVSS